MTMTIGQRAAFVLLLISGGLALAAEASGSALERWRAFIPAGWEVGDCPASYGADAVLCGGTDTGPWKVDRHIPTAIIRVPAGSCADAEKAELARGGGKLSVARRTSGHCGPSGTACTELRLKDARAVDPIAPLVYLLCLAGGPVEVVAYGVSARVIDAFEPVAREHARWRAGSR
jgi:hypothetical protein